MQNIQRISASIVSGSPFLDAWDRLAKATSVETLTKTFQDVLLEGLDAPRIQELRDLYHKLPAAKPE